MKNEQKNISPKTSSQRKQEVFGRLPDTRPSAKQRGYDYDWNEYRNSYFDDKTHCQCAHCGKWRGQPDLEDKKKRPLPFVIDHIEPHRRDEKLFKDKNNHQPLCIHCHNGWKQGIEAQAASEGKSVRQVIKEQEEKYQALLADTQGAIEKQAKKEGKTVKEVLENDNLPERR